MALIKCPECGRENVSDSAEACPDCGYGIKAHFEKIAVEEERKRKEIKEKRLREECEQQEKAERIRREQEHIEKSKQLKKVGIVIVIASVFLAIIVGVSTTVSNNQEIEKYCSMSEFMVTDYDSEEDCLLALLDCKEKSVQLKQIIDVDFVRDKEKKEKLQKQLEENFLVKADEIINAYSGTLPYSSYELKETIDDDITFYLSIKEVYDEGDYGYAFDKYIYFFSKTYVEDCPYYIVKTLFPKSFEDGIKERLLDVGVSAWGDAGQDLYDEVLTYIDSMPGGRTSYSSLISIAERQLYNKNEKEGKTVNGKKPPAIGMTAEEVRDSTWGSPQKINKDTYSWGVKEQWCYSGYRYIYLEDGIVTSISE